MPQSSHEPTREQYVTRCPPRPAPPGGLPEYLTVDEVSEIVRVPVRTLQRNCRVGLVTGAIKVGRDWRIPRSFIRTGTQREEVLA